MIFVLIAALAFSTSSPLAKIAVGLPAIAVAAGRTLVASVAILLVRPEPTLRAFLGLSWRERLLLVVAGAVLALHFALFLMGLAATSLPAAVSLVSLEPLSVVLVAWAAFKIRPTRREASGVLVATLGALVVASGAGQGEHRLAGDLMVLAAVLLFGAYVAIARGLRDALPPVPYAGLVYVVCTLLLAPFAVVSSIGAHPPRTTWLAILALGLVPTLVGHTLVQRAARTVAPAVVAMASPGETVGSLAIGMIMMGAVPSPREAVGALLVVLGATLAIWR